AVVIDAIASIVGIILTCFGSPDPIDETINVYSSSDINSVNPLPAQFKRVEISEGGGTNGKTIQTFTSPDDPDVPSLWLPQNPILSMQQRFAIYAYGLPKTTSIFDASNNKVKEIENIYEFRFRMYGDVKMENSKYLSCKCLVLKSYSQNDVSWATEDFYNNSAQFVKNDVGTDLKARLYNIYSGRAELITTLERTYKPGGVNTFVEAKTEYTYKESNYQIASVTVTQSNGDKQVNEVGYSADYSSGVMQTLQSNNILTAPVYKRSYVLKSGEFNRKLLHESVTEYTTVPNGDIRPGKILEQRFSAPASTFSLYQGPGNPTNPSYVEVQSFFYNNASKLAGIKDEGNRSIINIFDYDNKYVVASVINANANALDKSAYTSFETNSFGGWSLSGTAAYSLNSVTGGTAFILSAGKSLTTSLTIGKAHIISFWADNPLSVSGGTQIKSGQVINGFTYYEYRIPSGGGSVSVQGSAAIDELRSYPESARMRTVTYDPIIGKTSECDENNRVTYYEYDELGRLRFVKDEYRNIVKMYEYNSATYKSSGCTPLYTNKAITEYFRTSCGTGYEGTLVPVTIPAGKYSSAESQYLADLKAEMELVNEGQTRANQQGSCIPLYGNDARSVTFTKGGCAIGSIGSTVTYTVPANTYFSKVDKNDANRIRDEDIEANGYSFAEKTGTCTTTTEPIWESASPAVYSCQKNGSNQNTGTQLIQVTDVNPNSPTYNTTEWKDAGVNTTACPVPPPPTCDPGVCNKPFMKCVNNQCEIGVYEEYATNNNNICTITKGYRFSDGSFKVTSTVQTPGQCP
ncbi:MAG TPA: DUF5977 domain-containing protein, partial [Sphingobacteriaceae bacterium]